VNSGDGHERQRRDAIENGLTKLNHFAQFCRVRFRGDGMQISARDKNGFLALHRTNPLSSG